MHRIKSFNTIKIYKAESASAKKQKEKVRKHNARLQR